MDSKERRQLENQLHKMGLPGLEANGDPSNQLVELFADIINSHRPYENRFGEWVDQHKFFRDLLNECDADKRQDMYDALAPRLNFKAKPLHEYVLMIQQKAGALISKRRMRVEGAPPKPIEVGGGKYIPVAVPVVGAQAVAILSCWKCPKTAKFLADTPAGAMIEARKVGWLRDRALNKEVCPQCAVADATEESVTLAHRETLLIRDRRRITGQQINALD